MRNHLVLDDLEERSRLPRLNMQTGASTGE
jgi:hypothetical protein